MTGALLDLVTRGIQDEYEFDDNSYTFFSTSLPKKHTNFSIGSSKCILNIEPKFGKQCYTGDDLRHKSETQIHDKILPFPTDIIRTFIVPYTYPNNCYLHHGDFIDSIALEIELPVLPHGFSYVNHLAYKLIHWIEFKVGGRRIDKLFGEFMMVYYMLQNSNDNDVSSLFVSNNEETLKKWSNYGNCGTGSNIRLIIPIPMWFEHRKLPVIALQFHNIEFTVEITNIEDVIINKNQGKPIPNLEILNGNFLIDYIYLDTQERRRVAESSHEYMITQVQSIFEFNIKDGIRLNLDFPVKYLLVVCKQNGELVKEDPFESMKLTLEGHDRCEWMNPLYFRDYQGKKYMGKCLPIGVYLFSFCLKPFEYNPTGSLNFSRIGHAYLCFNGLKPGIEMSIYAVNTNIVRIAPGTLSLFNLSWFS